MIAKKALSLGCAVLALVGGVAHAQGYPVKAVRIVVGFAPGGGSDIQARILAQKLTESWGQSVVVDNRPGASGVIGAELVARAAPDGYTLLVSSATSTAVAQSLIPKLPYDVLRDFTVITVIGSAPSLLVVHPTLRPKTFQEFVSFARANQAKGLTFGGSGIGSTGHLTGELLNLVLGLKLTHVPYKGEPPALTDVAGGNLTFLFSTLPAGMPFVKAGKLRGLVVTSLQRVPAAAEYPTVAEMGYPGLESVSWNGVYAPAALPREIAARLNADIVKALMTPDVGERLAQQGIDRVANTQEQAVAYLKAEIAKWARVIKAADVRVE
jgi:tripartite-type tricarboxylate transporter receptor subunit TctC